MKAKPLKTAVAPIGRVVYDPVHSGHLTSEELQAEFEKLGRNDPVWSALMQLLQQRLANAVLAAADRDENAPRRIEELLDFQRELMAMREPSVATKERITRERFRA
jgi:uncharacterized protein with von Willebrand factor type A (vWA) domain